MAIVTFETVATAAQELVALNQRASVRNVIAHLGGGSPNAVLQHLADWKAGRLVVRVEDTVIDARITSAIAEQMKRVAADAVAAADERAASALDDLQTLVEEQQALEQQAASLTDELASSSAQVAQLTVQLRDLSASSATENKHLAEQIVVLRKDLSTANQRQELTVSALAKAEVRLEELPLLHADVTKLRSKLETENAARIVAERSSAVLTAQFDASEKRSKELEERVKKSDAALTEALGAVKKASEDALAFRLTAQKEASELRATAQKTAEESVELRVKVVTLEAQVEKLTTKIAEKVATKKTIAKA